MFEEVEEVKIRGEGFTGNLVMEEASCTFRINEDEIFGEYKQAFLKTIALLIYSLHSDTAF